MEFIICQVHLNLSGPSAFEHRQPTDTISTVTLILVDRGFFFTRLGPNTIFYCQTGGGCFETQLNAYLDLRVSATDHCIVCYNFPGVIRLDKIEYIASFEKDSPGPSFWGLINITHF